MMSRIIFICFSLFAGTANAIPVDFDFYQGGFGEGASITGMFTGNDLDNNGQLSSFDGEITDFMMIFSGNSDVSAFSFGSNNLFGLVYDLDGGPLGNGFSLDIEGIGAISTTSIYAVGPGPLNRECGLGNLCAFVAEGFNTGNFADIGLSFSSQLVEVSSKVVAEPSLFALLGIGLAGLHLSKKRKKA